MKICVVGAGSIGGLLGAKLALAGEDVTLIARGKHLEAIRSSGLRVEYADGTCEVARDVPATSDMRTCGPQDLVILGLKAHQIAPVVDDIATLFGPDTMVLTTQNGVPWWYFQRHGGEFVFAPRSDRRPNFVRIRFSPRSGTTSAVGTSPGRFRFASARAAACSVVLVYLSAICAVDQPPAASNSVRLAPPSPSSVANE